MKNVGVYWDHLSEMNILRELKLSPYETEVVPRDWADTSNRS